VAAAGLREQIEVRGQDAEEVVDVKAFDLAWIPAPFRRKSFGESSSVYIAR